MDLNFATRCTACTGRRGTFSPRCHSLHTDVKDSVLSTGPLQYKDAGVPEASGQSRDIPHARVFFSGHRPWMVFLDAARGMNPSHRFADPALKSVVFQKIARTPVAPAQEATSRSAGEATVRVCRLYRSRVNAALSLRPACKRPRTSGDRFLGHIKLGPLTYRILFRLAVRWRILTPRPNLLQPSPGQYSGKRRHGPACKLPEVSHAPTLWRWVSFRPQGAHWFCPGFTGRFMPLVRASHRPGVMERNFCLDTMWESWLEL